MEISKDVEFRSIIFVRFNPRLVLNVPNCVNLCHFKTRLFNIKQCFILKTFGR